MSRTPPHRSRAASTTSLRVVAVVAVLAALSLALAGPARAQPSDDARAQAGAAFKRALAAEKRQDWRVAIREYQAAYELSPHPDVLYNIAAVHERVGEARTAAGFYQRYLDGSPAAPDRAKVTGKLAELRARPGAVQITSDPIGAEVIIDGQPRGRAPLTVTLDGGSHQVVLEAGAARRSMVVAVEYGEPQQLTLRLVAGQGTLVVNSNAPQATVAIDGRPVGTTPWRGAIDAGTHTLVVSAPGFTTTERAVEVPADGTTQIQAALGRPVGWVEPTPPSRASTPGILESGSYLGRGVMVSLLLGYRTAGRHLEVASGVGFGAVGVAWALRARAFALTGPVRPYVVGGLNYGFAGDSTALVGGGLLIAGPRSGPLRIDYFIESGYGVGKDADGGYQFVPIIGGIAYSMSKP